MKSILQHQFSLLATDSKWNSVCTLTRTRQQIKMFWSQLFRYSSDSMFRGIIHPEGEPNQFCSLLRSLTGFVLGYLVFSSIQHPNNTDLPPKLMQSVSFTPHTQFCMCPKSPLIRWLMKAEGPEFMLIFLDLTKWKAGILFLSHTNLCWSIILNTPKIHYFLL